jgi:hypothetical protein
VSRPSSACRRIVLSCLTALACSAFALASETISGVVLNKTTGKPAAGDDIALLTRDRGSLEVSRGKTAKDGTFRLRSDVLAKHILRVRHDGVIYQQDVPASTVIQMNVFDAARDVADVSGLVTIMKIESHDNILDVTELRSIANESDPPLTQASEQTLKIFLPQKAALDSVVAQAPSSHPTKVQAKAEHNGSRNYTVGYPLFPGTTQFAIRYHLPYSEKTTIHLRSQHPTKLWAIMFPKSMDFHPLDESSFHALLDQDGMRVEAASRQVVGSVPAFVISGTGLLPRKQQPSMAEAVPAELLHVIDSHTRKELPLGSQSTATRRRGAIYGGLVSFLVLIIAFFLVREWKFRELKPSVSNDVS